MLGILIICILGVEAFCYFYLKIPAHMPSLVYFEPGPKPEKRLMQNADVQVRGAYREFLYRVTTDANGFRKTYPFTDEQAYSIAILGDSQTFGTGINDDQTFASGLAKNLGTSVLNTACPGYNTIEEYWTYKNRVRQFKPRQVLLFFFAGNDPYENFKNRELYSENSVNQTNQNPKMTTKPFREKLKNFLAKHSAIYGSLIKLRQVPQINRFFYRYKLVNPVPPSELAIFKIGENPQAMDHWGVTEKMILDLRREVESDGSEFWLVSIPDRYQIENDYWQQWVAKYNLNVKDFDLTLPNRHLAEFAQRNGINFLDTTESLMNAQNKGQSIYWKIDAHLNPLGHKVIADFVTSHLSKPEPTRGENK